MLSLYRLFEQMPSLELEAVSRVSRQKYMPQIERLEPDADSCIDTL